MLNKESIIISSVRLVDKEPGHAGVAQVVEVARGVEVAVQPEAARARVLAHAAHVVQGTAVGAGLARVAGVDFEEPFAVGFAFLGDEGCEFVVVPLVEPSVETSAFATDACAYLRQVFDHDHVRVTHDVVGEDVVLVAHVPSFSSRQTLEEAFGAASAFLLEDLAKVSVAPLVAAGMGAEELVVAGDGGRADAEVDADDAWRRRQDELGRGECVAEVDFYVLAAEAEAHTLALGLGPHPGRVGARGEGVLLASTYRDEADALRVEVGCEAACVEPDAGPRLLDADAVGLTFRDLRGGFDEALHEAALQGGVVGAEALVEGLVRVAIVGDATGAAEREGRVRGRVGESNSVAERVVGVEDSASQGALHEGEESIMVFNKTGMQGGSAIPPLTEVGGILAPNS